MKKIFNTIAALLIVQGVAYAQQPAHRTAATKVADVLAQQPAEENVKFLQAMKDLENFTAEDIAHLLGGLQPQGGNNAAIEFAANSYSFYVMQPGLESKRETFSKGLILALSQLKDNNNKAFVLELMKQASKNEAVVAISPYLSDGFLAEKAARALNAIRTPEATKALSEALANAKDEKSITTIVAALGDLKSREDEKAIIALLAQFASDNFQRTGFTALSHIAGEASAPVFLTKLKATNYQFDKSNVGGLAIDYAQGLVRNNQRKLAEKFASTIYKNALPITDNVVAEGALQVLTELNPNKQHKVLLKLASTEDASLQNTALNLLLANGKGTDAKNVAKSLSKATEEGQESIFNYLASTKDLTMIAVIQNSLAQTKGSNAKIAAYRALTNLTEGKNTEYLISQLATANEVESAALVSLILSAQDAEAMSIVNQALGKATDKNTKLNLLSVLAQRKNTDSAKAVLAVVGQEDAEVRLVAYQALPNVANPDDFEVIAALLANSSPEETKFAQQAITNALKASPDVEAKIKRLAANISRSQAPSVANYFPIFAGIGGAEALTAVKNYSTNNTALKEPAIRALSNWSNPEVLPDLVQLTCTEKDAALFNTVFRGLVKQINASAELPDQKTLLLKDAFALAQNVEQKRIVLGALTNVGTYQAFIFASKYLNDKELGGVAANAVMTIAMDHVEYYGTDVRNILNVAMGHLSGSESSYLKEALVRHLAEMPKGEGYVSIFNGQDLTGWKGLVENPIARAKMSEKELAQKQSAADKVMRDSWSAINGDLVFSGHGDNIATVKQYGDFEMLVDWKLDKEGHEPDAGVYLRGTPQVQMWDISRTNVGAQVGSGGLYNNTKNPKDPIKVADNALGEWNTMKIKMVGEKVWVWLNGHLVVDNVTLENYWDRNQSIFPKEQIELQAHGSRVWYRDIFIKELVSKEITQLSSQEGKDGYKLLFDGSNFDQWTASAAYEITDEGYIRSNPEASNGTNLYTKEEYGDFSFKFDFKLTKGANNGVGIRTPLTGDAAYEGMEIQILDDDADVYKDLKPYQYHGSVYGIMAAKRGHLKPLGEWNTQEIRVKGNQIEVTLNGTKILSGDLAQASKQGPLDSKEHPGLKRVKGHIGFLGHGTEVFFKNIRVKRL